VAKAKKKVKKVKKVTTVTTRTSDADSMSASVRNFLILILMAIMALILVDLITDSQGGASVSHLLIELSAALVAGAGIVLLLRSTLQAKADLQRAQRDVERLQKESDRWRDESRKWIEGLGQAIDSQLERWAFSASEKEVALLLLKGLSLKEIAQIRQTSEKTARAQASAVYHKSGTGGRSELAAFFLEDLLVPSRQPDSAASVTQRR
jgi:DNA-binding CsgD family transcriptional regulator